MSELLTIPLYRLTDANGVIIPNGRLYTYESGGLVPAATYTTSALSTSHGAYVAANSAGLLPPIYLDPAVTYRTITKTALEVAVPGMDFDPVGGSLSQFSQSSGSAGVGFLPAGVGAVATTLQAKGRQSVSVLDYTPLNLHAGIADGTNTTALTAYIQAAIDTGAKGIVFPSGTYKCVGVLLDNDYQALIADGPVTFVKSGNGVILTISGRGCRLEGFYVNGLGATYTGNNINVPGHDCSIVNCSSVSAASRALYITGTTCVVSGGIYITLDSSGTGFDIEVNGVAALYTSIWGIKTTQTIGGIKIDAAGAISIVGNQMGKISCVNAGGGFILGNRIVGAATFHSSNCAIEGNGFAGGVTIGDGSNAITGVMFGPTNIMSGATTFTLSALVTDSSFHLGQLQSNNVTLTLNATSILDNDIWHGPITWAPTIAAGGGSPTFGNGTTSATYTRHGRNFSAIFNLTCGTTTSFGTGNMAITLPFNCGTGNAFGSMTMVDGGVYVGGSVFAGGGTDDVIVVPTTALTPGNGDTFGFEVHGKV